MRMVLFTLFTGKRRWNGLVRADHSESHIPSSHHTPVSRRCARVQGGVGPQLHAAQHEDLPVGGNLA
jgi:hypothetical protein